MSWLKWSFWCMIYNAQASVWRWKLQNKNILHGRRRDTQRPTPAYYSKIFCKLSSGVIIRISIACRSINPDIDIGTTAGQRRSLAHSRLRSLHLSEIIKATRDQRISSVVDLDSQREHRITNTSQNKYVTTTNGSLTHWLNHYFNNNIRDLVNWLVFLHFAFC